MQGVSRRLGLIVLLLCLTGQSAFASPAEREHNWRERVRHLIVTIFDHGRRTFRRGNLPYRAPPLSAMEKRAWQQAHETGEAQFDEDCSSAVWVWPIHEAGWKREILRTLLLNDDDAE